MIVFKGSHYPENVVFYLRYSISYRDLEEIIAKRCIDVDHATLNAFKAQCQKTITCSLWLDMFFSNTVIDSSQSLI